jgi:hypothetical protein
LIWSIDPRARPGAFSENFIMTHTCIPHHTSLPRDRARPTYGQRPHLPRRLCGALFLAVCLPAAMASNNAELRVVGRVVPAPCTITLGNNGNADFGNITAADLPAKGNTRRPTARRMLPFSIQCIPANSPTLSFRDERTNSIPAIYERITTTERRARMFGLGRIDDKSIGMYEIYFGIFKADGKDVRLAHSQDGEAAWQFVDEGATVMKDYKYVWSTNARPQSGSFGAINGELGVMLWPEPLDELPLQSAIRLDGSTTLVLEYP